MENIIECKNLKKKYRGDLVLEDVDLAIGTPSITGVIGRNGAGKTTLLKILSGFIKPTSGEVRVFSENPFNSLLVSANSILIDDGMTFPDSINLKQILDIAPSFYKKWDSEIANKLFVYFQLDPKQRHSKLSKGKRAAFNMIFGLSTRCELTIFDEPTNGMDEAVRADFYRALLKDYIAHPRTILISSHHLAEIENILEDILLIDKGKIYFHKSVEDLREYAISGTGPIDLVNSWMEDKEVIYSKRENEHYQTVIVKTSFTEVVPHGITIKPVSVSNLCRYVTEEAKGEIDDVFE